MVGSPVVVVVTARRFDGVVVLFGRLHPVDLVVERLQGPLDEL